MARATNAYRFHHFRHAHDYALLPLCYLAKMLPDAAVPGLAVSLVIIDCPRGRSLR
jgi:hypothetical protein